MSNSEKLQGSRLTDTKLRDMRAPIEKDAFQGLDIVIIGGGPAGLSFAYNAAQRNPKSVTMLEMASDPRISIAGYLGRSHNFTMGPVGRWEMRDPHAWQRSARIIGREIHTDDKSEKIIYGGGKNPEAYQSSLTRPQLQQNIVDLARGLDARLIFSATVLDADPHMGRVIYQQYGEGKRRKHKLTADFLVYADGGSSNLDEEPPYLKENDPLNYVSVVLPSEIVKRHGISLDHLHYWKGKEANDAFAFGVPDFDGNLGLVLLFPNLLNGSYPFANTSEGFDRLNTYFPQLLKLDPTLPKKLRRAQAGRIDYKIGANANPVVGKRGVQIGEKFKRFPFWVGAGMNVAIHSGGALARAIERKGGEIDAALSDFGRYDGEFAKILIEFAKGQRDVWVNQVMTNPSASSGILLPELMERAEERASGSR